MTNRKERIAAVEQIANSEPSEREISYTLSMQPIWQAQQALSIIKELEEENKILKSRIEACGEQSKALYNNFKLNENDK